MFNSGGALIDTGGVAGIPDEAEGTPPASNISDAYIVGTVDYDDAGRPFATTDNVGRVTNAFDDLLGRRIRLVENYDDGDLAGDGAVTGEDAGRAVRVRPTASRSTAPARPRPMCASRGWPVPRPRSVTSQVGATYGFDRAT